MIEEIRPRREFKPRSKPPTNPKMFYIIGGAALFVVIISYFVYSNHEKSEYINLTLAQQASFNKQIEIGEFKKSLPVATSIQSRIDARANIFSTEQKNNFSNSIKNLKRQIEIKEIFEKLQLELEGENSKSLTKVAVLKKDIIGKINLLKTEMNPFLVTLSAGLLDKVTDSQKVLFREEYRKTEKEWDKQIEEGKFVDAAKLNKEYLEKSKDPLDKNYNAFIEKSFPLATNKYELQRKIYEDGLVIYKKGVEGNEQEYDAALKNLEAFIQKVPLEYPRLQKELKITLSLLNGSQRNRLRTKMNNLPLESFAEKAAIETKAFGFEMPAVAKNVYSKSSKQELEKLSSTLKSDLAFFTFEKESIDEIENNILLVGKEYTVKAGFGQINNTKSFMVEINGVRFVYGANYIGDARYAKFILNHAYECARKIKLNDEACEMADQNWTVSMLTNLGFGLVAETTKNGTPYLLMDDKIFKLESQNFERKESAGIVQTFRNQVKEFSTAITQNSKIEKEVAMPLSLLATAISENIDYNHQITRQFAQLALENNYFENAIPNCPTEILEQSKKLKSYFEGNIAKLQLTVDAKNREGSEAIIYTSLSGFNTAWMYDKEKDETAFVRLPSVIEMDSPNNIAAKVSAAMIYSGRQDKEPKSDPIRIEARHPTGGILATYDYQNKKFYVDMVKWNRHILSLNPFPPELFGIASWSFPPHILNIDANGDIKEMFVPNGRFALSDFSLIKNEDEKLKAKNEWLNLTANILKSSGELHLLFKYFAKYTFDSPIPNLNNLIGNNSERGDFHQTVYQTIERSLGKKMLCDCDDLAEVYADITKRQGKLSYVMAVPGHATCGWVEKLPDGYAMNFLDTGPPRRIFDKSLDMAIEKGVKAYDQRNLQGFNARNVAFLFRFAGEQVRQGYQLDSKVMVDTDYGCNMVNVQESWHFHYFLQGSQTMEGILEKDKDAANYFELAGLNREMGIYDQAARIYKLGLDQLDPKDEFGLIQSNMTYINYVQKNSPAAALVLLKENEEKLKKVNASASSKQLVEFNMANYYLLNNKPVEAYKLILNFLNDNPNTLNEILVGTLTSIYSKLNDKIREGQAATDEEKAIITRVDSLIKRYYDFNHFKAIDDINGSIGKYGGLFSYYIGKYGWDACLKKLKENKFPKTVEKNHVNRSKVSEDEDWDWIRLSLGSYYSAIFQNLGKKKNGAAADDADPDGDIKELPTPEKWKEALQYEDSMEQVYAFHKANGLGKQSEYTMLLVRMLRGVVEKNDKLVDATLDKMKQDDWTSFYRMVADTIGGMSGLVPKEDFMKLFNKFASHNPPKQHFMGIAYKAFFNKKYDIALAVAEASAAKFRGDAKMEKEVSLLRAFVAKQKPTTQK